MGRKPRRRTERRNSRGKGSTMAMWWEGWKPDINIVLGLFRALAELVVVAVRWAKQ